MYKCGVQNEAGGGGLAEQIPEMILPEKIRCPQKCWL